MPFSWCYYDSFRWFFFYTRLVRHWRPYFCVFFSADNTQILSIFLGFLSFAGVSATKVCRFETEVVFFCTRWLLCCRLGDIQEVDCEHGANWMIRRMGLELHHHNNIDLIAMTQKLRRIGFQTKPNQFFFSFWLQMKSKFYHALTHRRNDFVQNTFLMGGRKL